MFAYRLITKCSSTKEKQLGIDTRIIRNAHYLEELFNVDLVQSENSLLILLKRQNGVEQ